VTGWERIGSNLVNPITTRRLTVNDLSCSVDGVGVVDTFALVGDSEHG
jgi:hypothetical protein